MMDDTVTATATRGTLAGGRKGEACVFEGQWGMKIKAAPAPSDVQWENLCYSRTTMWKRQLISIGLTLVLLFFNMVRCGCCKATWMKAH